jgi:hypothetical protein
VRFTLKTRGNLDRVGPLSKFPPVPLDFDLSIERLENTLSQILVVSAPLLSEFELMHRQSGLISGSATVIPTKLGRIFRHAPSRRFCTLAPPKTPYTHREAIARVIGL